MNTISKENADEITRKSGDLPKKYIVKADTLEKILSEYLPAGQTIDFLTVDVESHNFDVLKSNNWKKFRPLVVLAESDNHDLDIDQILNSEIVVFMKSQEYTLTGWVKPTLVFRLKEDSSFACQ